MKRPIFERRPDEISWNNTFLSLQNPTQLVRDTQKFRRKLIHELKLHAPDTEKAHALAVTLFKNLRHIEARRFWPITWRPRIYPAWPLA